MTRRTSSIAASCVAVLLTWLATFTAGAAEVPADSTSAIVVRPAMMAFTFDVGGARVLDTYLTPIRYEGLNVRLGFERMHAMRFSPDLWVAQVDVGVDYQRVKNIPGSNIMHSLMCGARWGMMRRWHIDCVPGLQLMAGGGAGLRGGAIYNANNSNNPVSVKIHCSIDVRGLVAYNFNIGRLPVTLRYEATLPFIGAFFSPEYGQSFYEIYLGDRSGIVHCGWWGNRFDMSNLLTVDLHLGRTSLRLGYRGLIETSFVNNINYQYFTHGAVIGVSGEWLQLRGRRDDARRARVISALY